MAQGRCPGCGLSDPSCKKVRTHMLNCPEASQMFKDGKEILDPVDEYKRWKENEFAQERDERHAGYDEARAERQADVEKTMEEMGIDPSNPFS